jgi:hypothetical protein
MLVYSAVLSFDAARGLDPLLEVVARWLNRKTREVVPPAGLHGSGERRFRDGSRIETWHTPSGDPALHAMRYTHADKDVSGRQWVTEIGLRYLKQGREIECTVLVSTNDISTRVTAAVQASRPLFVADLLTACAPTPRTCGLRLIRLDATSASDFRYLLFDADRHYPLIVVSPTATGDYLVDLERLRALVAGVAEVVQIPAGTDTFAVGYAVGREYAAWLGGANVVFPPWRGRPEAPLPTRRFLPVELEALRSSEAGPETEIFSVITHRTNLPNSWRHVSPALVREEALRREVARRRAEAAATGDTAELVQLLEQENQEQLVKISGLESLNQSLEDQVLELDDQVRQRDYTIEALKAQLEQAGARRADSGAGAVTMADARAAFAAHHAGTLSLEQSLVLVSALYPERLVVLETAWRSAKDAVKFRYGMRAFDLLYNLVTAYWEALAAGKGDQQARAIFGAGFAARESEGVESNHRARELRTFVYRGQSVEMMKHLKIGVKDSAAETFRAHFEWFPDGRRLVIGHCGAHLDHR